MRWWYLLINSTVSDQQFQHCCESQRFQSSPVRIQVSKGGVNNYTVVNVLSRRILYLNENKF